MKVAVLGTSGMLGNVLSMFVAGEKDIVDEYVGLDRSTLPIWPRKFGTLGARLSSLVGLDADYVINCIGATKPYFNSNDPHVPIYVNAVFPHQLASWCDLTNTKLINITTDCVYDGAVGGYTENDKPTATDDYGRSKSLGESPLAMNIRTSIIGFENNRNRHLLEWVMSQDGKTINGFTNHKWNGLTILELTRCILDIIDSDVHKPGTFHVFSNAVTKEELVKKIIDVYKLDITVNPFEAPQAVDRTLDTIKDLNGWLDVPNIDIMLDDLAALEMFLKDNE